jgi:hypothetical protein
MARSSSASFAAFPLPPLRLQAFCATLPELPCRYNDPQRAQNSWDARAEPAVSTPKPPSDQERSRKKVIIPLALGIALLFGILLSQSSFDQPAFLNPDNNQQLLFFAALSALIFLLFVALTFVLFRNLLKLFAERRLGVLGSKFRTRLVVTGLLLSFLPVIVMFWFAYGLKKSVKIPGPWPRCSRPTRGRTPSAKRWRSRTRP